MSLPSLTFAELKNEMSRRSASGDGIAPSSLANALSALTQFMEERGYTDDECVGTRLRISYYKERSDHIEALQKAGRTGEYIRNRKALLKRWRALVAQIDNEASAQRASETPFHCGLREMLDGSVSLKSVAEHTKVPYSTLKRWLAGSLPTGKAVRHVQVLEKHFGQPPGALTDLLPGGPGRLPIHSEDGPEPTLAFRQRQSENSKLQYALKDASPELQAQWVGLVVHKTSATGAGLKRQPNGKWKVTQQPVKRESELQWYGRVPMMGPAAYCATGALNWVRFSQFLGFLSLPIELGGQGLHASEVQSLACLTEPRFLDAFVEWQVARSGGTVHEGTLSFLRTVRGLCHPKTGYLTQSRSRFASHPDASSDPAWFARCQAAFERAKDLVSLLKPTARPSRDPKDPIAHILAMANPLSGVTDAVARMNAARPNTGGLAEALWARDRLILKLLASNPLRALNLKLLTIRRSPSGAAPQLHKKDGVWRIAIPRDEFKNHAGAAKHRDYDVPVCKKVAKDIEVYLNCYRPLLADPSNPYLFTSSKGSKGPFHDLNKCFARISKRYFTNCPGVGPHAMRHIVATAILKRHPNAWAVAAYVLHDLESTVRKNYAHLKSEDSVRWVDSLMSEALEGF